MAQSEISFGVYILGNNQYNAHLLLACPESTPRKKARGFIETISIPESLPPATIRARYPGLLLADSSRLPLPVTTFVASAGEGEYITTDALPAESVYCDTPIPTSACGLPIYVHGIHHHAPLELGRSTLGGIIKAMSRNGKKEAFYGLTVAHAFTDVFQIQTQEDSEGDSELSFEGDLYMDGEDVRHVGIQEGQIIIPYCLSQLTFF